MSTAVAAPSRPEPTDLLRSIGVIASGTLAGAITGLVAGGIGSRLAMRILALTSPDAQGATTEAGEIVGEISLEGTVFLLLAGAALGLGGGLAYLAVRRWLPHRARGLVFGVLLLAIVGRLLVDPDNLDFLILDPAWLAVATFAALPILFGLLVRPIQARLEPILTKERSKGATALVLIPALLPLAIGGPFGLAVVLLIGLGMVAAQSNEVRRIWRSSVVDTLGRVVLLGVGLYGLVLFTRDVVEII